MAKTTTQSLTTQIIPTSQQRTSPTSERRNFREVVARGVPSNEPQLQRRASVEWYPVSTAAPQLAAAAVLQLPQPVQRAQGRVQRVNQLQHRKHPVEQPSELI